MTASSVVIRNRSRIKDDEKTWLCPMFINCLGNRTYLGCRLSLKSVVRWVRRILLCLAHVDLQIETKEEDIILQKEQPRKQVITRNSTSSLGKT